MSDENTQAAFFEKVNSLVEEGKIKVELRQYQAMDEKMTFCCHIDGYFQSTPKRFMERSVGCPVCSTINEESAVHSPEGSEGHLGRLSYQYMEKEVSVLHEAILEQLALRFDRTSLFFQDQGRRAVCCWSIQPSTDVNITVRETAKH